MERLLRSPPGSEERHKLVDSIARDWLEFHYNEFTDRERVEDGLIFSTMEESKTCKSFRLHFEDGRIQDELIKIFMNLGGFKRVKVFENGEKQYFYVMEKDKFNKIISERDNTEIMKFVKE